MREVVENAIDVILATDWNYIYKMDHRMWSHGFIESQRVMDWLDTLDLTNEEYNHLMKIKFELQKW